MESKEALKFYVEKLLKLGFKKHEIAIKKGYGIYFIELPYTAYDIREMGYILDIFPPYFTVGIFPGIKINTISIRTDIKVGT